MSKPPPPLVSAPRLTTLIASLFVALSSGTNYVYSAYSPQLGQRLGMSHTQLNIVALAGNIGVYITGPIWGKIVDARGPRILLGCAFVFLLTGYMGMRHFFNEGLPEGVEHISLVGVCTLVFCSLLTGAGGNGGLTSSVNSTAKTFPDKARASTTGLVISGFGLSAFFFGTLSRLFFAGNTSAFFLLLALGTSCPMIMGFFLVRPIPLPAQDGYNIVGPDEAVDEEEEEPLTGSLHRQHASHLLDHDFIEPRHSHYVHLHDDATVSANRNNANGRTNGDEDGEGLLEPRTGRPRSLSRGTALELDLLPNLYGKKLFKSGDFWLCFSILSILSGTGLMYINNVGSMSQTLYAHENDNYDPAVASGWQAAQVSTISLTNFLGRVFIGLVSDVAKNRYSLPRSYSLVLVSSIVFASQIVVANIEEINNLWLASSMLGLGYGSIFSLMPTVCLEWFGMPHFSENWGFISLSPMIGGNLFSIAFGRNLDSHDGRHKTNVLRSLFPAIVIPRQLSNLLPRNLISISSSTSAFDALTRRDHTPNPVSPANNTLEFATGALTPPKCLDGKLCYVDTIYLTIAATFFAILLSIWAGWRDRNKILRAEAGRRQRNGE